MSNVAHNAFVKGAIETLENYVNSLPAKGGELTKFQRSMANNLSTWLHENQSVDFTEVQKPIIEQYIYQYQFYKNSIKKEGADDFSKLLADLYKGAHELSEEGPAYKGAGRIMK